MADCQGFDVRFPFRAADGSMSMDRLLPVPARSEASSGSRTRLPLHPTGNLAGRFAPCLACDLSRGLPVGPELAGLGSGFLQRPLAELALTVASHWRWRVDVLFRSDAEHCVWIGIHCVYEARHRVRC